MVENLPSGLQRGRDGASGKKSSGFFFFAFLLPAPDRWSHLRLQDLPTREKAKALRRVGVINIRVDGEGKQNELVCDGSLQPRDIKTWIAGLTKYP